MALQPNPGGGFVLLGLGVAALVGWLVFGKKKAKRVDNAVCWTSGLGVRECEPRPLSNNGAQRLYDAASRGSPEARAETAAILRADGHGCLATRLEQGT